MQFNISDKNRVIYAKERFLSGCHNQIKIRNQIATMNQTPPIEGPFYANDIIYTDVIAYNGTTYDVAYKNLSLCDRMKVCLSVKNNINLIDCNNRIPGISLFKTHMLICEIAAINGDYNTAILQIKKCLEITTELQFPEDLSLKLQLGRYLNEVKATDESEEINTYVLKLLKEMDNNSHKLYLGDALYNMATLQNLKCNYDQALIEYEEVIREYKKCKPRKWQLQLVEARCYRKMYEIYLMQEKNVEAKIGSIHL